MRVAHRLEHTARRLYDHVGSACARRRYKHELGSVRRFCLFVGYPQSGHSVVGGLLNAHRHAVVSHSRQSQAFPVLDGYEYEVREV